MLDRSKNPFPGVVGSGWLIGIVLGLVGLPACQDAIGESGPTTTIEDGVSHVRSPGLPQWGDDYRPFTQAEILGADLGDEAVTFAQPLTVSTGADGTRFILDAFGPAVFLVDPSGNPIGEIGRNGEGPGEFARPTDLLLNPDGSFAVLDPGNFRISFFDADGEFQSLVKTEVFFSQFEAAGNGSFYAYPRNRTPSQRTLGHEIGEEIPQVSILNPEGGTAGSLAPRHRFTGELADIYVNKLFLAPFTGDSLLVSYQGLDLIEVWAPDGTLGRVIHRPPPFELSLPRYDAQDREPGTGPSIGWEYDVLSSGLAVHPSGAYWAVLVPQGRARYRTPMFGESEIPDLWSIELYDREGQWLSRQPLDFPCANAVLDWGSDGLYLLNPFEDAAVYRFEFHPKPTG